MDELFDLPAADPAPTPERGRGQPRVSRPERHQVALHLADLDACLPPDHRARIIWRFVEGLVARADLDPLYERIRSLDGGAGRPAIDPAILVALWLLATAEEIGSSRALERLCDEHDAYRWICGGVSVNYHTLSDFRVADPDLLERILVGGVTALADQRLISLERVAGDGMRVRAAAGARSFGRRERLEALRDAALERVARLRAELDDDPAATSRRIAAANARAAREMAERADAAIAVLPEIEAQKAARTYRGDREAPPRASATDHEARFMDFADRGKRPALNVQFASTTAGGIIAAVDVVNCTDQRQLAPMAERLSAAYGEGQICELLFDGGYAHLDTITDLAAHGITVYCPVQTARRGSTRDPHVPLGTDSEAGAAWRVRMGTEEAQQIYRERAATAELVNAQARNRGLTRFRVRGRHKARAVALWYALTHNLFREVSLRAARDAALAAG